ncbi:hypothetical protein [Noviherbaspirillum galbum]|uniref:Uncharacterized protein n=1 Tax=Noviherbaspirillum galbum TaxID=2709383 RepID=A0A6B3SIL9_9BURK|nr:hypothetical protein [Noviherbaspirillum galbum]NEX60520.1 hypothetical protein [Noviherbaspirillum galbum]
MNKAPASKICEMNIMDRSGHKQLTWDTAKLDEILNAQETFDELVKNGYTAFGSTTKAEAKHSMKEFDPTMEELVMVPKTVGG